MLKEGIYEKLINKELDDEIKQADDQVDAYKEPLDEAESPSVFGDYAGKAVAKALAAMQDNGASLDQQAEMLNEIMDVLAKHIPEKDASKQHIVEKDGKAQVLNAVINKQNSLFVTSKKKPNRPETSIAHSSLFTGANNEPNLYQEFKMEIRTCDRIDFLVSFIKWSGLRLMIDDLIDFTKRGGKLRIITTTYMGATEPRAIAELSHLPNTEIKISYDTKRTRLHAKTYVFYRNTGYTTAYIGSSNISNAAMSAGLEWNMKITEQDLPETFKKIDASFNTYWNSQDFETYTPDNFDRLQNAIDAERRKGSAEIKPLYNFDINPYPFQQEILDQIEAERKLRGNYKNLIVAATGTGKTVLAAFDYRRWVKEHPQEKNRLLFVAHREEILKQALGCFRGVLKDPNFGSLLVGQYQTLDDPDHLFVSIQSFNSKHLNETTSPDAFDYIILDESHHDAAPVYQTLLGYYTPKVLLGLTATPERMDGKSILPYFNNIITAEIRLPEAIDRKLLAPFQYFVVTDVVNLNELSWQNGGYVKSELEKAYIGNNETAIKRADSILFAIDKYIADLRDVKGLGFCVTVEHAQYMANYFNEHNVPSIALTGDSSEDDRKSAADRLTSGEIKFIFTVDIYNEGVDIPAVNTVLFLRPTESLTVFLQQLGRGLRLSEGKDFLTVLDFVGKANRSYNFEDRFTALLEKTHRDVTDEIKKGFLYLPKGCFIQMERQAQTYILENIEAAYKGNFNLRIEKKLQTFTEDTGKLLTLANFFDSTHVDPRDLYLHSTLSQYEVNAGIRKPFNEKIMDKNLFAKAMVRFAWLDSVRFIRYILQLLEETQLPSVPDKSTAEYRMLQMFQYTLWNKSIEECGYSSPLDGITELKKNPICCMELVELLYYRLSKIDFIDLPNDLGFDCPLDVHCTYTRDQLFTAMDYMSPHNIREGVKWLPDKKINVLLITLNKSDKEYSPTTLYNDYSESEYLFHWQSQSTTSLNSATGQRYIHHAEQGSKIVLFVRESKNRNHKSSNEAEPYVFLGTATFVSCNGSNPMNIIWKLDHPIPAKYLKSTNKLLN